jgi:hypothetical protein
MSDSERVVTRSSCPATFANAAPLRTYNRALNTGRRLPAPRGAYGIGKAETAAARELIETWWLAHGGTPPQAAPPALRGEASGPAGDPWQAPPES